MSAADIAEALETDETVISEICAAAEAFAPEYQEEDVLKACL